MQFFGLVVPLSAKIWKSRKERKLQIADNLSKTEWKLETVTLISTFCPITHLKTRYFKVIVSLSVDSKSGNISQLSQREKNSVTNFKVKYHHYFTIF